MRGEEARLARELAEAMRAVSAGSTITIREDHRRVDVGRYDRSCRVHCFWCEAMPGRDAGVVRFGTVSTGRRIAPSAPRAEYLLALHAGETRVAEGRAHSIAEVIGCVRAWVLDLSPIEALYEPFPFVDRTRRSLTHIAAKIEAGLQPVPPVRVVVDPDLGSYDLWAYGEGRACTIEVADTGAACAFLIRQSQAAHLLASEHEIVDAVAAWTQERVGLEALRQRHPALIIERHCELLAAGDVARWHWLNVLDCARDPADLILPAYLPLIEQILERPSISSFFSFTSHGQFCFSASSNYPVTAGLPVLLPAGSARYAFEWRGERREADVAQTLELIDAALAAAPHRPFHGSMPNVIQPLVDAELARQGSSLRVELRQRGAFYGACLRSERRTCELDATEAAAFCEGPEPVDEVGYVSFPDLVSMVRAARRWVEDTASLEEMSAEVATWAPSRKVQLQRRREERRRARERQGPA